MAEWIWRWHGYNAGENAVIKYGYTIPPYDETRNYVKLIIKRYGATNREGRSSEIESLSRRVWLHEPDVLIWLQSRRDSVLQLQAWSTKLPRDLYRGSSLARCPGRAMTVITLAKPRLGLTLTAARQVVKRSC